MPGSLTGQIALVTRGTCTFVVKVKNCQNAGAIGVIVADNAAGCRRRPSAARIRRSPFRRCASRSPTATALKLIVGLNVTLETSATLKAGADVSGRVLHVHAESVPERLVGFALGRLGHPEPADGAGDQQQPVVVVDLTMNQMSDIGWLDAATPIFVAPGHV